MPINGRNFLTKKVEADLDLKRGYFKRDIVNGEWKDIGWMREKDPYPLKDRREFMMNCWRFIAPSSVKEHRTSS